MNLDFLVFILLVLTTFYLPGRWILRITKYSQKSSAITGALSFCIGMSTFLLLTFLLSYVHASYLYFAFSIPLLYIEGKKSFIELKKIITKKNLLTWESLLIVTGCCYMAFLMWKSGRIVDGSMEFYGVNAVDAIWHLSLIGNLKHQFPPTHPGFAGEILKGYNFFYDFAIAMYAKFYPFSLNDLFFRYYPMLVAFIYGMSILATARFLQMNRVVTALFLFLMYFASGFDFIFSFILSHRYDPGIVHTSTNIVDPSVIVSVSFFLCAFVLIFSVKTMRHIFLPAIILGIMPMIKIYSAFLIFIAMAILAFKNIRTNRMYVYILLASGCIASITYLPINFGAGGLIFAPFLFFTHYMESSQLLVEKQYYLKFLTYREHANYLRIGQLYMLTLALFYLPSLGIRLASLVNIKNLMKKSFYTDMNIFWMVAISTGILLPMLFIQNVAVFVIIQFLWVVYFLLLLPTAYGVAKIIGKPTRVKCMIVSIILVLLCIPEVMKQITIYSTAPLVLSRDFVKIIDTVKFIPHSDGVLVLNVSEKDNALHTISHLPLVSATAGHDVYFEPEVLDFLHFEPKIAERKRVVAAVTTLLHACDKTVGEELTEVMQKTKNTYLVTMEKYPCLDIIPTVKNVTTHGKYAIYKI